MVDLTISFSLEFMLCNRFAPLQTYLIYIYDGVRPPDFNCTCLGPLNELTVVRGPVIEYNSECTFLYFLYTSYVSFVSIYPD